MRNDTPRELAVPMIVLLVAVGFCLWLTGCTSVPTCQDNPRNMRCMTADQLEKELNQ